MLSMLFICHQYIIYMLSKGYLYIIYMFINILSIYYIIVAIKSILNSVTYK